jgi:hypothetical protein
VTPTLRHPQGFCGQYEVCRILTTGLLDFRFVGF